MRRSSLGTAATGTPAKIFGASRLGFRSCLLLSRISCRPIPLRHSVRQASTGDGGRIAQAHVPALPHPKKMKGRRFFRRAGTGRGHGPAPRVSARGRPDGRNRWIAGRAALAAGCCRPPPGYRKGARSGGAAGNAPHPGGSYQRLVREFSIIGMGSCDPDKVRSSNPTRYCRNMSPESSSTRCLSSCFLAESPSADVSMR